jgi:hypothetical protein
MKFFHFISLLCGKINLFSFISNVTPSHPLVFAFALLMLVVVGEREKISKLFFFIPFRVYALLCLFFYSGIALESYRKRERIFVRFVLASLNMFCTVLQKQQLV